MHWSLIIYQWDSASYIWHIFGKKKALHPLRQKNAHSPGKCFTTWWEPQVLLGDFSRLHANVWRKSCPVALIGTENTCFQFKETVPECRHEEQSPRRTLMVMLMIPQIFMTGICLITMSPVIFSRDEDNFHYSNTSFYLFWRLHMQKGRENLHFWETWQVLRHQFGITHSWDMLKIL